MIDPLLAIGLFLFGVPRLAYDELQRSASWRWGDTDRYGARTASQFLGPGVETLTLTGHLVPELAGEYSDIDRLREMAASGEVWPVILGTGELLGSFRIDSVEDTWRHLIGGGRARSTEFTVQLTRIDG